MLFPVWLTKEAVSLIRGFLVKKREDRLGCGPDGANDIKAHSFFRSIDWVKLERREVEPPFKPVVVGGVATEVWLLLLFAHEI